MIDKAALVERAIAWARENPPYTGYTEKVFRAVCKANLPNGANIFTQICAQFTGKEEAVDLVHWDTPEWRLPYSNTHRYSLDRSVDCSSALYVLNMIFWGMNIGTWTEAIYSKGKNKQIPWRERRIGDIILYNFKQSQGRNVSHAAVQVIEPDRKTDKGGMIAHTTSPSDPWRFESDNYAAKNRVCVIRFWSDSQYQSLFVTDHKEEPELPAGEAPRYRYIGATYTNFRSEPRVAKETDIGDIKNGDIVEKIGGKLVGNALWWKVRHNGQEGWCTNTQYFAFVTAIEKPPVPEPVWPKYRYAGATYTNFRSEPRVTKETDIGDIRRGDIVEKIGEKKVSNTTWWKVRHLGREGWCANTHLFRKI